MKLSEAREDPRKSVGHQLGHQLLLLRIRPLIDDMHRDLRHNSQAIERMLDEGTTTSQSSCLKAFESRLWILFSTRFDTTLFLERTERDIYPLCSIIGRVTKYETIVEDLKGGEAM